MNIESIKNNPVVQGSILGTSAITTVFPLLYIKNVIQAGEKIVLKNCGRGYFLSASSVVPQAAIAITINSLIKNMFFQKDSDPSLIKKLAAAYFAGGISGQLSTPIEFVIQNYQTNWQNSLKKVVQVTVKQDGMSRLYNGACAMINREGFYAMGYLVMPGIIEKYLPSTMENQDIRIATSAGMSGAFIGYFTNFFDVLRANKQQMNKQFTYVETIKKLKWQMRNGAVPRSFACSIASIIMAVGNKKLNEL